MLDGVQWGYKASAVSMKEFKPKLNSTQYLIQYCNIIIRKIKEFNTKEFCIPKSIIDVNSNWNSIKKFTSANIPFIPLGVN